MWHSRPPRAPSPPFMANAILNFHFDYLHPSLTPKLENSTRTLAMYATHFASLSCTLTEAWCSTGDPTPSC